MNQISWQRQLLLKQRTPWSDWLCDQGSTCARLAAEKRTISLGSIEVKQVTSQAPAASGWLRKTLLKVDGSAWMWAEAWLAEAYANANLLNLIHDEAPIGQWLFAEDASWQRSPFEYCTAPPWPLNVAVLRGQQPLAARRSSFNLDHAQLQLTEVFLAHPMWGISCK